MIVFVASVTSYYVFTPSDALRPNRREVERRFWTAYTSQAWILLPRPPAVAEAPGTMYNMAQGKLQSLPCYHSVLAAHPGLRMKSKKCNDLARKTAKAYVIHSRFTVLLLSLPAQGWASWESLC